MKCRSVLLSYVVVALTIAACDAPRDPEGTSERVRGNELVAGWNSGERREGAPETAVIERLARQLHATVRYREGATERLFRELDDGAVHLVAGNLGEPFVRKHPVAASQPVTPDAGDGRDRVVVVVRQGENAMLMAVDSAIEAVFPR